MAAREVAVLGVGGGGAALGETGAVTVGCVLDVVAAGGVAAGEVVTGAARSEIVPVKTPAMGSRFKWKVAVLNRKYSPWLRPLSPTQFMGPSVMVISLVANPVRLTRTTMACCRRELRAVGGR